MRWHLTERNRGTPGWSFAVEPHLCTSLWMIRALDWKREPRTKL